MESTFDILGIPDAVGGTFAVFAFIIALSPYVSKQDFGIFKTPQFEASTTKRLKVVGPIVFLTTLALFLPLWPTHTDPEKPVTRVVPATDVTFSTIPNLNSLTKSFSAPMEPPPTLDLAFRANRWNVNFPLTVSAQTDCFDLKRALLSHFSFEEHISVNLSRFPLSNESSWSKFFLLTVNGEPVEASAVPEMVATEGSGPRAIGHYAKSGDALGLQLHWAFTTSWSGTVSGGPDRESILLEKEPDTRPPVVEL